MYIRHACGADCDALVEVFMGVAAERLWIATEPDVDPQRIRAGYMRTIELSDYLTLVAEVADCIVGTIRLKPDDPGYSLGMHVVAGYRGMGIGTAALDWARTRNADVLRLGVFAHNNIALCLYENAGFRIATRRDSAYLRQTGEVFDLIEMEWRRANDFAGPASR